MSNKGFFTGRVAKAPIFRDGGKTSVCFLTLIRNEFSGQDEGSNKERKVAIPFTAFGRMAETLSKHAEIGDQLFIEYRIANNDRERDGQVDYGFSFILETFEFGAPGEVKRERLTQQAANSRG